MKLCHELSESGIGLPHSTTPARIPSVTISARFWSVVAIEGDTALISDGPEERAKAPSPLRSGGALQMPEKQKMSERGHGAINREPAAAREGCVKRECKSHSLS
jgi:hypothetical protein